VFCLKTAFFIPMYDWSAVRIARGTTEVWTQCDSRLLSEKMESRLHRNMSGGGGVPARNPPQALSHSCKRPAAYLPGNSHHAAPQLYLNRVLATSLSSCSVGCCKMLKELLRFGHENCGHVSGGRNSFWNEGCNIVEFSFRRKDTVPSTTGPYCPLGTVPRAYEGMGEK
jgi:hypothetical protein